VYSLMNLRKEQAANWLVEQAIAAKLEHVDVPACVAFNNYGAAVGQGHVPADGDRALYRFGGRASGGAHGVPIGKLKVAQRRARHWVAVADADAAFVEVVERTSEPPGADVNPGHEATRRAVIDHLILRTKADRGAGMPPHAILQGCINTDRIDRATKQRGHGGVRAQAFFEQDRAASVLCGVQARINIGDE